MLLPALRHVLSLLALSSTFSQVRACSDKASNSTGFAVGNDGPADPATLGYTINHFALIVNCMETSLSFYRDVLGMRTVFTFHASDNWELAYLGYPHGGKNGTGYQSGDEMFAEKTNNEGLVELLYLKKPINATNTNQLTASTTKANTLSHIGLIVPDIMATQERMKKAGVHILKEVGQEAALDGPIARAFGVGRSVVEARKALAGIRNIGFDTFLLATDPDGNMLEIQPQKLKKADDGYYGDDIDQIVCVGLAERGYGGNLGLDYMYAT